MKVKGSRPMTYQYLTVDMVKTAKENGGFIGQKKFKTGSKYGFDSLILTDASMHRGRRLHRFREATAETPVQLCTGH